MLGSSMKYIIILYATFFNCKIGFLEFIFILFCISLLEIRIVWKILDHFACCLFFFNVLMVGGQYAWASTIHIFMYLQVRGYRLHDTTKRQKLTRSLMFGSEMSLSTNSESRGASCDIVPFSKPYMFRSAMDAASAAIDYSKGNIDDGVVDSPPSRGPKRTPLYSPSPLKRLSSSHRRSLSPTPRTDRATSRKLQLPLEGDIEHPRVKDVILSPSLRPSVFDVEEKSTDGVDEDRWDPHLRASVDTHLRQVEDNGSHALQFARPRRLLPTNSLFVNEILEKCDYLEASNLVDLRFPT